MLNSEHVIAQTEKYGANNYHPLSTVITKAEGKWKILHVLWG